MKLVQVEITDFALIDRALLMPGPGLTVMTGETGAGKSILIDAISVLCGGRASREMIRSGCDRAVIEAVFEGQIQLLPKRLIESLGLENNDIEHAAADEANQDSASELILTREIFATGRNVCRLNGRLIPLSLIKEISSYLIDIHGQHDQQAIFKSETHLQLLDRFGGTEIVNVKRPYRESLKQWRQLQRELEELGSDPAQRSRMLDMLRYQVREIETANLKSGEEEKLTARRRMLANAEKIMQALAESYARLTEDQPQSLLISLGLVSDKIEQAARHVEALIETKNQIEESLIMLQTAADDIRNQMDELAFEPGELEQVDERLDLLYRLKQKYGGNLEAVLDFYEKAVARIETLDAGEAVYEQLMRTRRLLEDKLIEKGQALASVRRKKAAELEKLIAAQLKDLGMPGIRFSVSFNATRPSSDLQAEDDMSSVERSQTNRNFSAQGMDEVAFVFSANPGEPMRPLAKIASGGEASRIMLAIKVILAQADRMPVLIFDEIDSGVSGHTADRVAEKLTQIAQGRQVFCITHLAQIAAMADMHILIEKQAKDDRTSSHLHVLSEAGCQEELGRLLSGGTGQSEARTLAARLLAKARQFKAAAE